MAVYLVDYENVYIDGLDGLEELSEQDEVAIFYTQNRCGLTFDLHKRLVACKASLRLMEVCIETSRKNAAKNALDLQLSMYIGYLLGSREQLELYIISKDHDFDLDLYTVSTGSCVLFAALSDHCTCQAGLKGRGTGTACGGNKVHSRANGCSKGRHFVSLSGSNAGQGF